MTLGAIGVRRHTGQLTIDSDGKRYCVAFDNGQIVAATSPMAADTIARVALTNHFITSTQVPEITRRLAAAPERDEVEVLAEMIRCLPEQILKLRHRLVAQRTARTFSIERGEFVLDDRITLPVLPGVTVDCAHTIYLGVRTNLSEQRLLDDLRQLGGHFVLKPEALDEIPRFEFDPAAQPVLEALQRGTSLPELEAAHREVDPRSVQAIIYALVSCNACIVTARTTTTTRATTGPVATRTATRTEPAESRTITQRDPDAPTVETPAFPDHAGGDPAIPSRVATPPSFANASVTFERAQSPTGPPAVARSTTLPAGARTTTSPYASRTASGSPTAYADAGTNTPAATRTRSQPDAGSAASAARAKTSTQVPATTAPRPRSPTGRTTAPNAVLDSESVPHAVPSPDTAMPHTARTDTDEDLKVMDGPPTELRPGSGTTSPLRRPSSPRLSRTTSSDADGFGDQRTPGFTDQRTPGFGFGDQRTPGFTSDRTPGFTTDRTPSFMTDRTPGFGDQRTPSDPAASRTTTGAPASSRVSTDNAAAADAAFKRGEAGMRRDQPGEAVLEFKTACDLNPQDVDYAAMLAWAKFCAAGDKAGIGVETRRALERAVYRSPKPERARFYLGRVERMLGRDKEALRHFQEVLDLKPNHADAASEIRAIEARLQAASKSGGLFGRKR